MCSESVSSSAPASVVNRVLIQCSIHKWSYQAKRTLYICCFISCSLSHNCRVMISLDCVCHKTDKKGSMTPPTRGEKCDVPLQLCEGVAW